MPGIDSYSLDNYGMDGYRKSAVTLFTPTVESSYFLIPAGFTGIAKEITVFEPGTKLISSFSLTTGASTLIQVVDATYTAALCLVDDNGLRWQISSANGTNGTSGLVTLGPMTLDVESGAGGIFNYVSNQTYTSIADVPWSLRNNFLLSRPSNFNINGKLILAIAIITAPPSSNSISWQLQNIRIASV